MPTHDRIFTAAKYPDMKEGEPVFGGFRMYLQLDAKVQLAIGDSIKVKWEVPGDEYWRFRGLHVLDNTNAAGAAGQGWKKQFIHQILSARFISGEASAADNRPQAAYNEIKPGVFPVWNRQWDGATYLAFLDAIGNVLNISPKDPTWTVNVLPPGSSWQLHAVECEFAAAAEFSFDTHILVDRYIKPANMPDDEADAALWVTNQLLAQSLQGQG